MVRMLLGFASLLGSISLISARTWTQCGGRGWYGATTCPTDFTCVKINDRFSQCQPNDDPTTPNNLSTTTSCPRTLTSTYTEVVFPHPVTCPPTTTTVTATPIATRVASDICTSTTVVVHTVTVTATPSCLPTTSTVTITPTPFV